MKIEVAAIELERQEKEKKRADYLDAVVKFKALRKSQRKDINLCYQKEYFVTYEIFAPGAVGKELASQMIVLIKPNKESNTNLVEFNFGGGGGYEGEVNVFDEKLYKSTVELSEKLDCFRVLHKCWRGAK